MNPGRYRVVRSIKRGGIAEVLEAVVQGGHDFERRVVIKQLLPEFVSDQQVVHAFIDEARIVGQLGHPNVVSILDFGMLDDRPFQVLEYVDGLDLEEIAKVSQGGFPVPVALHVVVEIARALDYAHAAVDRQGRKMGIVHRDVTPANILLSWNGDAKLADFGVARAKDRIERTQVGLTKGTFAFMAPEQVRAGGIDGRADLFSLGCVLHWMLTGESPVGSDTVRMKVAAGGEAPVDPGLPNDIAQLIKRATRTQREDRFPTAGDLADGAWPALLAHSKTDVRRATRQWLAQHRPQKEKKGPSDNKMADLFDLALLGNVDAPVRRYQSVVAGKEDLEFQEGTEIVEDVLHQSTVITQEQPATSLRETAVEPSPLESKRISDAKVPVAKDREDSLIGRKIHGYRLSKVIGKGGWSTVYLAKHERLQLEYAVKVLSPNTTTDIGTRRLHREAQAMSQLRHPNIAQVVDFGEVDGRPFLTMEMLRGRNLYSMIVDQAPFSHERIAFYARQIATGLAAAHEVGLVHRDLKPANVMIVEEQGREVVKLLDFGIARTVDAALGETRLTAKDRLLGTPTYMAPEQILSPSNVTHSSDLYSLGIVMYRMLRKSAPFEGSRSDVVQAQLRSAPPSLDDEGDLGELITALLAKKPGDRPADAHIVVAALDALGVLSEQQLWSMVRPSLTPTTTEDGPTAPPPTSLIPAPEEGRSMGLISGALMFVSMATMAGVLGYTWYSRQATPAPPPPPPLLSVQPTPQVKALPRITSSTKTVAPAPPPPQTVLTPRKPKKRKPKQRTTLARAPFVKRYRSLLASNGLTGADASRSQRIVEGKRRLDAALDAGDGKSAEKAMTQLTEAVAAESSRAQTIERKIERVSRALEEMAKQRPATEVEEFESRYFALRVSFKREAGPTQLRALARKLTSLEREINRASKVSAP